MKLQAQFSVLMIMMFFSGRNFAQTNKERLILGTWEELRDSTTIKFSTWAPAGYQFLKSNICENKLGYFKYTKDKTLFLGTRTKYKIEDDSLKIYDPGKSTWISMLLLSAESDKLKIKNVKGKIVNFRRIQLSPLNDFSFDQIIITSSGCYGSCPIATTSISKNGEVFYNGTFYTNVIGNYTGKISSSRFKELVKNFGSLKIQSLEDHYRSHWTDDETITITFVSNGEILKTISDYGRAAPTEFIWAYIPLRFLDTQLQLDSLVGENSDLAVSYFSFEIGSQKIELGETESFYLWGLLQKAAKTNKAFQKKYKMNAYIDRKHLKIETDGRFFEFVRKGGQKITYDIGFNFIDKNSNTLKFSEKRVNN